MKVIVKNLFDGFFGFYGFERRRPGDTFELTDPSHFSKEWMEKVDSPPKTKKATSENLTV